MDRKEIWLEIMKFIHDEEINSNNLKMLLEMAVPPKDPTEINIQSVVCPYLELRGILGADIKIMVDHILKGERKKIDTDKHCQACVLREESLG